MLSHNVCVQIRPSVVVFKQVINTSSDLSVARFLNIFVNRMAEELVSACGGIMNFSLSGLILNQPGAADLRRMVAEAAATTAGKGSSSGGNMRIECRDGSCLQFYITPLSRRRIEFVRSAPSACAAIFISRPGSLQLSWRKVALYHGLTQAEAKLAIQLANGKSLEESAESLHVSIHTVRTHLKSIFSKTGAKRQSELVAQLLQGVLAQCHDGEHES